jgi:hypothetical protein
MATFIVVYHGGVVIPNEISSYEFVRMKKETFLLNEFPALANMVHFVHERLGWMDECEVWFEGQIDIESSNGPWMKTMSSVCDEKEWTAYVGVMMKPEIHRKELVVRMVSRNDVGDESSRSPTFPKVVDEQHVECGIVVTQPSQETQVDTHVEETTFIASNETVFNVKPVYQSVGVGDAAVDTGFISGVDHQPIATGFALDVDLSFVELEFMPEYEAAFGDDCAKDSAGEQLVLELRKRDKVLLQQALVEHSSEMTDCRDLI